MREIFENVSGSPRLRRFTTSYLMVYFIITLSVNLLIRYLPILDTTALVHVKNLVVYFVEGALLYGLIRGIVTKNYRFGDGIASFGETENYIFYLAYSIVNTLYNALYSLTTLLADKEGAVGIVGTVLTVVLLVFRLLINFGLVRLYFEKLVFGNKNLNVGSVFRGSIKTVSEHPKRIILAELMPVAVKYVSTLMGVAIISVVSPGVDSHWMVSFVTSCLVTVQFGALVYVWPVYYLYYKETCEM